LVSNKNYAKFLLRLGSMSESDPQPMCGFDPFLPLVRRNIAQASLNSRIMSYTPHDLLTAERHIAEGEQHIVRQEEIVTKLQLQGADTTVAEQLLAEFHEALNMHREDRDRIAAELGRSG
jgi:hypothetical protein